MSGSVDNFVTRSRSESLDDRDVSVYETPRPETPYVTPNSTPRLIHCSVNPVKIIRQHVPLKINFAQIQSSDQGASSKFNEVKPVNTKKVRCVIQPNPLYQDGDGDQCDVPGEPHIGTDAVSAHCHSRGDATAMISNDNQPADETVAVIEKEIDLMDEFVKGSIKRLQMCCDVKSSSDCCDVARDNCDKDSQKGDKIRHEKAKNTQTRKSSCVQENHDLAASHRCDKKKFYDPEDIRKYMMKKKNERQLKEKEEKHKKESEARALKRKSEATKMLATKTRIPVARHHTNDREVDNKLQNGERITQCSRGAEDRKINKNAHVDKGHESRIRFSKNLVDKRVNVESRSEQKVNGDHVDRHECDNAFDQIDDTERRFVQKFNDIIYKCAEDAIKMTASEVHQVEDDLLKRITTKLKTPEKSPKIQTRAESVPNLPKELDVLKSKNPFNFLNILKGKVNLAKHSNEAVIDEVQDDQLIAKAFASSPSKRKDRSQSDKDKFLEDIIKRRLKLGNSVPLAMKLNELNGAEEHENVEPIFNLKSELTLDDLELSPVKHSETYRILPAKKSDRTFSLRDDDLIPKNASILSGIRSLSASDERMFSEQRLSASECNVPVCDDVKMREKLGANLGKTLSLESLKAHNISLSLPDTFIRMDGKENWDVPVRNSSMDFKTLLEDESVFGKGIRRGINSSSYVGKREERGSDFDVQKPVSNESSIFSSDDLTNLSTTAVFLDIYDQMIRSEDEKLSQILKKIHQQKEALSKYLKTEVLTLESKKIIYREKKDEEKIKTIKKRQRAILLKITNNIQELDKMKKSVVETVERRKAEILRQKNAMKEKKEMLKQKCSPIKKKKAESPNRTFLITKNTNTHFTGLSSSDGSIVLENEDNKIEDVYEENELEKETNDPGLLDKISVVKDTGTSPVNFNAGISIRLEPDAEKLLKLKSPCGEIKIDALKSNETGEKTQSHAFAETNELQDNPIQKERGNVEDKSKKIKIKRPLSPIILPSTKKVSQMRRLSSSSDVTFASFNDTTTDQSDVELRISALQEQLRQRKLEAERLRREEKQLRKEKLKAKEQSLLKQLEAYDQYIQRVTKMLSEDRSIVEVAKPQIKPSKRPSFSEPVEKLKPVDLNETLVQSEKDDRLVRNRYVDDVDADNTEDSEKHLRKADSGILMESEVTEASENVEIGKSKSESEIHSEGKSEPEKADSEKRSGGSKSVDNFLQLINDIQSEVVSMSEQVYSSDFVEDIPEDIADSKSETSVANDYNTSVSIEEILSDHPYQSDTDLKPSSIVEQKSKESHVQSSNGEDGSAKVEESDSESHLFVVKNISDIESVESEQAKPTVLQQDTKEHQEPSKSTDSQPLPEEKIEFGTTSEMSPIEEIQVESSQRSAVEEIQIESQLSAVEEIQIESQRSAVEEIQIESQRSAVEEIQIESQRSAVEEIQIESQLSVAEEIQIESQLSVAEDIQIESQRSAVEEIQIKSSERSPIAEIKSVSSLETPTIDVKEASLFFEFSHDDPNEAVNTELVQEFFKYESENSSVPDVDEPVRKMDDIETMMDGFRFSVDSNDITHSEISEKVQKNFDQVLKNLESYFSVKMSPVDTKSAYDDENAPKTTEMAFEETDVSESLEYDTSPDRSDTKCKIELTLLEKNKPVVLDDEKIQSEKSIAKSYSKSDEFSAEEDRSVEEFLEDYSIPNLGVTTFIVNEDSESEPNQSVEIRTLTPSPDRSIPEKLKITERDGDLDLKINMNQTPFLQALQRERESLFGQKPDIVKNVTTEMLDKLVEQSYASAIEEITKNVDSDVNEQEKVGNATSESDRSKIITKVDGSILGKHADKFDSDWFDKELIFNRERLKEAEELRLQQLRIEQEIEELQAQQHIPPYLYIREIPNKPPPPYTPPSEHTSVKIPNNEAELCALVSPAIYYICNALKKGRKIDDIKQLPEYTPNGKSSIEITTYKKFIFDLTKEVARNILENSKPKNYLPWESSSKSNKPRMTPNHEILPKMIENEILVLFGFKSRINKEKLIIQWSRKKRNDFVDDLLIKELQEEETEWTNYEEDENIIKNQITQNLLDDLIQETVDSLQDAFKVKNKFASE